MGVQCLLSVGKVNGIWVSSLVVYFYRQICINEVNQDIVSVLIFQSVK